jgi:hypothetical protein
VPRTASGAPSARDGPRCAQQGRATTSSIDAQKTYCAPPREVASARTAMRSQTPRRAANANVDRLPDRGVLVILERRAYNAART